MATRTVCLEMPETVVVQFESALPDAPYLLRKIRSDGYLVVPAGANARNMTFKADTVVMADRVLWVQ